jgi:hypothetical protein
VFIRAKDAVNGSMLQRMLDDCRVIDPADDP